MTTIPLGLGKTYRFDLRRSCHLALGKHCAASHALNWRCLCIDGWSSSRRERASEREREAV